MAKKQLNKNLIVTLTLCGFAVIVFLSVLMLRQLQKRDPKYFVELATKAEAEERWRQAALFYHEAWERGGDAAHLVHVGENLLREGEVGPARLSWRQALVHHPKLIDAHVKQLTLVLQLAQLYGSSQDWDEVRTAAEAMLKLGEKLSPGDEAFARNALGAALVSLESRDPANAEKGLSELKRAGELAPDKVEYAIELAHQYAKRERVAEAERIFADLLAAHGGPGEAASTVRLGYAKHLANRQKWNESEAAYQESLSLAPPGKAAREAKLGFAAFLSQRWVRGQREEPGSAEVQAYFDRAEGILRECIESEPNEFEAYLPLAVLYKAASRFAEVVDLCEKRLQKGFSRRGVEATKNRVNTFTLMIYASEACVALGILDGQKGNAESRDRWLTQAEQYVTDAKGEAATHPRVLSQAGRVKIARGLDRPALEDLRAADEAYTTYDTVSWENRMIRARVHLKLNEPGAAKSVLEEVMDRAVKWRASDPAFWNLYAQVLFQIGDYDRSMTVADRVLIVDTNNREAKQLKAAIFERQGKLEQAQLIVKELSGTSAIKVMLEARRLLLEGNTDEALRILREALAESPGDVSLVSFTANELLTLDRREEAEAIVKKAMETTPEDSTLQRLAVMVRPGLSPEQRDAALLSLIESEPDAFRKSLDLIMFHSRKNDGPKTLAAIDNAERHLIARDTPQAQTATMAQHAALLRTKLRIAAQIKDDAAAEAARESATRNNVDGAGGKSLLGLYHMQRRELALAVDAFREAIRAQPTDVSSLVSLGQCLQILGRPDESRASFERAVKVNPQNGYAHQGLAVLAEARGDREWYRRELTECERLIPSDPWVRDKLTQREDEADPVGAIARREESLEKKPDDIPNLKRLAVLCEVVGDRDKADRYYDKLLALSPDDEEIVLAAAGFYRRTDRAERSLEIVKDFSDGRPTPRERAEAQLLVAGAQISAGDNTAAERTLLAAAEMADSEQVLQAVAEFYYRTFKDPEKSLPWFDKAVDLARSTKSANLPIALEARIDASLHRRIHRLDQARKDVDELRQTFPEYHRGLLWESELQDRLGNLDRAIGALSEFLQKQPGDAFALYRRANYQIGKGRTTAAIEDLETLKRMDPLAMNLDPRIHLARLHQISGRSDLRVAELEALVKDAPGAERPVQELAEAYISDKRFQDAERLVTAEINRGVEQSAPVWHMLRGRIGFEMNAVDRALSDFRRAAELTNHHPFYVGAALNAYGRAKQFREGVEYFQGLGLKEDSSFALVSRYALILGKAGDRTRAVEPFRRATALALREGVDAVQSVTADVRAAFDPDDPAPVFETTKVEAPLSRANDRLLIRLHGAAGRFDRAIPLLDSLLATASDDRERSDLLHEKGDVYLSGGRADEAIAAYEESVKYRGDNWIVLNNIAYLFTDKRGDYKLALPYARRAAALADNADTLDTLGWIYVGLGEFPSAIAELSRAVRLKPGSALSFYHLAEAYRRHGDFTEAADVLANADKIETASPDTALRQRIETARDRISRRDSGS